MFGSAKAPRTRRALAGSHSPGVPLHGDLAEFPRLNPRLLYEFLERRGCLSSANPGQFELNKFHSEIRDMCGFVYSGIIRFS